MRFDAQLSIAELDRAIIGIQHSLRRIRINGDKATAKTFYQKLSQLEGDARHTYKALEKKNLPTALK